MTLEENDGKPGRVRTFRASRASSAVVGGRDDPGPIDRFAELLSGTDADLMSCRLVDRRVHRLREPREHAERHGHERAEQEPRERFEERMPDMLLV